MGLTDPLVPIIEGAPVDTAVEFLGGTPAFGETNLLEEEVGRPPARILRAGPYAIRTLKLPAGKPGN